jgi:hypothetical protein
MNENRDGVAPSSYLGEWDPKQYNFVASQPGTTPRHRTGTLFLTKTPDPRNRRKVICHLCEIVSVYVDHGQGFTRYGLLYWGGEGML